MGVGQGLTSGAVMKRYNLDNASSVQHSLANLSEDKLDMIHVVSKLENPQARFEKERQEGLALPTIPKPR